MKKSLFFIVTLLVVLCIVSNVSATEIACEHTDTNIDYICDVEACKSDLRTVVAVSVSASKTTLKVGETATVIPNYTTLPENATVSGGIWTSSDSSVASVSNGTVTALKKGITTITVSDLIPSAGVALDKTSVSIAIVVNDGGEIVCDNMSTASKSATVCPSLVINGQVVNANFTFSGTEVYANSSGSAATVHSSKSQVVAITISVVSYPGSTYADLANIPNKVVYVSFYDVVNSTVKVKNGVSSFMFDDTNVFSTVTIDGVKFIKPEIFSAKGLLTCNADWHRVELYQEDPVSTVASISYPGSLIHEFSPTSVNTYSRVTVDDLKFTCLNTGSFVLWYTLLYNDLVVQTGTITIEVSIVETPATSASTNMVFWETNNNHQSLSLFVEIVTSNMSCYSDALLICSAYDSMGKLSVNDCQTVSLENPKTFIKIDLSSPTTIFQCKVFLLDRTTFTPFCSHLTLVT